MLEHTDINIKRACNLASLSRASWYREPEESRTNRLIRKRLRQLAVERPAFGTPRLTVMVQREFGAVNHKRVERLYGEEGLQLPRRQPSVTTGGSHSPGPARFHGLHA